MKMQCVFLEVVCCLFHTIVDMTTREMLSQLYKNILCSVSNIDSVVVSTADVL